jgi:hypothetical protein
MQRGLIISAVALAAVGLAAAPAVAGLAGNPSFSHQLPVRVPSQARTAQLAVDDHGRDGSQEPTAANTREPEPADDNGGATSEPEPADDNGGATSEPEPGDDNGGATSEPEPGDDNGGATTAPRPTDDHGGDSGRHGGSDG